MNYTRRHLLKAGGLSCMVSFLPFANLFATHTFDADGEGFVIDQEAQETYLIGGRQAPVTIMVDKKNRGVDSISLCMEDIKAGDRIPVHKHLNEVEIIFIQKGSGIFTLADKEVAVKEGGAAFVPKGVWHGLRNTGSETLRMMFSYSPSGFEGYFREIGVPKGIEWKEKTPAEFAAIDEKYGIVYKR